MEAEILEILIGKYIDGEITPSEQEMLDEELERDFEAREFIKQLQELDKQSRETVSSEVVGHGRDVSGRDVSDLFERAWQRCRNPFFSFLTPASGWFRFATGLAAGLLIGIGLHFVLAGEAATPS
ncbi:MAG: anti-sigma factor, partial [Planctomycetota bacterium]